MKVMATLNNYQIGSYTGGSFKDCIVSKTRIDTYHTQVVWEIDKSDLSTIKAVLGATNHPNRIKILED